MSFIQCLLNDLFPCSSCGPKHDQFKLFGERNLVTRSRHVWPYVTPLFPRPLSEWRRYHGDMGIPIPKTLVIWASPVILTLIAKVIWEGDAHITSVLEMGMPISLTVTKTIASHADEPLRPRLSREAKSGKMPFFLGRAFLLAYAYGQLRLSTWSWSRTQIWERDYSARGWKNKARLL